LFESQNWKKKKRILGSHGFNWTQNPKQYVFLTSAQNFTRNQAQKHSIWSKLKKKKLREQTLNKGNRILFALKTEIVTKLTKFTGL
jgi:hypothetical protein